MRKTFLCLLLALTMLLPACGAQKPGTADTDRINKNQNADGMPSDGQSGQTIEHAWEIETEEEMLQFFAGEWALYNCSAHADVAWLTMGEDGTFAATVDTASGLWGADEPDAETYSYKGTLEFLPFEEAETPFIVRFRPTETDDAFFDGWDSIGDFIFTEVSLCDGELLVNFGQANNGESFLSERVGMDCLMTFMREDARTVDETAQRKNDTFNAAIWKSRYGDSSEPGDFGEGRFVLWVDDVEVLDDYTIVNDVRESVPYIVSDGGNDENLCMLSGGPAGWFVYDAGIYQVTTDENGEIIDAVYIPTTPTISEENAAWILESIDEVRMMMQDNGMTMLFDGEENVWGENCRIVWLGTDHPGNFVREVEYAVTPYGDVYRYDVIEDCWNWVDPEAMG